jgi:hypothetical protein
MPKPAPNQSQKFQLYLKARQMSQAQQVLNDVKLMKPEKRKAWLKENSELVEQAFDGFIQESNQVLGQVGLDEESLKLSQTIVQGIKDSMDLMGDVVYKQQELES